MPDKKKKSKFAYERKSAWLKSDQKKEFAVKAFDFADGYKTFLDICKTEREGVDYIKNFAIKQGYKALTDAEYKPGEKIYAINGNKNIILVVLGKDDITKGINLIAAHLDSPRLDLKQLPLIEDNNIALLKTHYYGGIKKYHWLNIPLALHGIVVRRDGSTVNIVIGEDDKDPVFTIPDLLIHLSKKVQGEKKLLDGIEGENLNLMVGNIPVDNDDMKEKVKETVLAKLNEQYGIVEEDFISAEFEVVPAFKARDIGIDRSMVGGYGHDDRVCSYATLRALTDINDIPQRTMLAFFVDKEEIGSYGISGIRGSFFKHTIARLISLKDGNATATDILDTMENSFAISGDVGGLINPMFESVHDTHNSPVMGYGMILEKYTGSGGKYGASDASAEYIGKIRKLFNDNKIGWQPCSLGKVDEGGGGTVALYIAEMGIPVIDAGVGVIGMHSPFEVISKADLYQTYLGYKAFLEKA